MEQKIINTPFLEHIVLNQKIYLPLLAGTILLIPLLLNFIADKPLLMGQESYYHLQQLHEITVNNLHYSPLYFIKMFLGDEGMAFLPPFLAVISIILCIAIAQRIYLPIHFTFFFLLFVILSPVFIYTFTTLSAASFLIFLSLSGFFLLTSKKKRIYYCALIPFILGAAIDLLSTILLVIALIIFFVGRKEGNNALPRMTWMILGVIVFFMLLNVFLLEQVLALGPFSRQIPAQELISDLGAQSGISFFVLLLSFVGIETVWKRKISFLAYSSLLFLAVMYIYRPQSLIFLSSAVAFFAAQGFFAVFDKEWVIKSIKLFTLLLFFLGMLFSTLTYINRVSNDNGPFSADKEALTWIGENTAKESIIFSSPENSYYLRYFAQRQPFYYPHEQQNKPDKIKDNKINKDDKIEINNKANESNMILAATYIDELSLLLEKNKIRIIYLNAQMKRELPAEQGLRFLLKNEKFKLVHSYEDSEVWVFRG